MTKETPTAAGARPALPEEWRSIAEYVKSPPHGSFPALALLIDAEGDMILGGWHKRAWMVFFDGNYGKPSDFVPIGWRIPSLAVIASMAL